jgi:hypothetical protein
MLVGRPAHGVKSTIGRREPGTRRRSVCPCSGATLPPPCAHCGGAFHEPLTMAAKRHRRDPRAVLEAFRALDTGGPSEEQIESALRRVASP